MDWCCGEHLRQCSQSTSAGSSPTRSEVGGIHHHLRKAPAAQARIRAARTSRSPRHSGKNLQRRRPNAETKIMAKVAKPVKSMVMKTPAISNKFQAAPGSNKQHAEHFRSPGGTDYIVTPGRHKILMTEFLASFDREASEKGCPGLRGTANYMEPMLQEWLNREKKMSPEVFLLSFRESSPMEDFRQMAIHSVFSYAVQYKLHEKTVHLCCFNLNRLIHGRFLKDKLETKISQELFGGIVAASIRHAIKNDESYEKADKFRLDPDHIWRISGFLGAAVDLSAGNGVKRINSVEVECLRYLENPSNPPLSPEFLDRYIAVGAWPNSYQDQYRELASYLLGLALFASGHVNPLRGTTNSKLAAAALVLAVKVINTDKNTTSYEFWPNRLAAYTSFTLDELKPAIRGLAMLLRSKPKTASILEKYYSKWSAYDWN